MYLTPKRTLTFWGDTITTYSMKALRDKFEGLLDEDPDSWITLEILSTGGDCMPGYALSYWIMTRNFKLQTIAVGPVQSMAVILFLAGQHRVATPNASFFLHQVANQYKEAAMNLTDHIAAMGSLKTAQKQYLQVFRSRVPNAPDAKELKRIFAKTVTLSPKKAMKWGIVHEIVK